MWFLSNKYVGLAVAFPIITSVSYSGGMYVSNMIHTYNLLTGLGNDKLCVGYTGFQRNKGIA